MNKNIFSFLSVRNLSKSNAKQNKKQSFYFFAEMQPIFDQRSKARKFRLSEQNENVFSFIYSK
jgi:hypothetical protein